MRSSSASTFTAPARVNLLGEHTDYTGGYVFPMAIQFETTARVSSSADGTRLISDHFKQTVELDATHSPQRTGNWSDYPLGVLQELRAAGVSVPPFTLELSGNIPFGSGLSSSASVEVATAYALLGHARQTMAKEQVALLCQRAENVFVGSPCGIMDQFAITCARAGHALLLNTETLKFENIPLPPGFHIVVCNSMVRHSIASGEYGTRRKEVEAGQEALRRMFPGVRNLAAATVSQLEQARSSMSHESFLRCRHIITDNARALAARDAMLASDAKRLGELMLDGHASERDDFAVSVPEVDFLVETASALPGCFGARLTGGGFGGCTVNLVRNADIPDFITSLQSAYEQRFGIHPEIYNCEAVDGAARRAGSSAEAQS